MKEPKKFPGVLSAVMLVVAILFGGAGALGYMAYGSDIQTVVLVNLPQDDKFVQAVQFLCKLSAHSPRSTLIPRFHRYSTFHPITALPSRQDHGEWSVCPIRKA
jgi:amino acid permease